jgi:hypothetical protein
MIPKLCFLIYDVLKLIFVFMSEASKVTFSIWINSYSAAYLSLRCDSGDKECLPSKLKVLSSNPISSENPLNYLLSALT